MTRAERTANMIGVVVPFLGLIAAVVLLWNELGRLDRPGDHGRHVPALRAGRHGRLPPAADAPRRSRRTSRSSTGSAIVGSMGLQGGVLDWVADHRKHHAHTDQEGDPHSPHVGHGEGLRGLWHAHTGWLFETHGQADWKKYARELYEDRGMRGSTRLFPLLGAAAACSSRRCSASSCTASRSRARCRASSGAAWSARSSSTTSRGRSTPSATTSAAGGSTIDDLSTNVFWLALPSLGEAWHHNHHAFPRSAAARPALVGDRRLGAGHPGMEKVGLAWNVVRISPERQAAKEAERKEPVAV